jgi:hypothetical protein
MFGCSGGRDGLKAAAVRASTSPPHSASMQDAEMNLLAAKTNLARARRGSHAARVTLAWVSGTIDVNRRCRDRTAGRSTLGIRQAARQSHRRLSGTRAAIPAADRAHRANSPESSPCRVAPRLLTVTRRFVHDPSVSRYRP